MASRRRQERYLPSHAVTCRYIPLHAVAYRYLPLHTIAPRCTRVRQELLVRQEWLEKARRAHGTDEDLIVIPLYQVGRGGEEAT